VIAEQISGLDERPPATVYLKVPAGDEQDPLSGIKEILRRNRGDNPVVLYFESSKKAVRTTREWWVDGRSGALAELVGLLGEESVCVKD
jgi:DNA polymerase-3 subunit alpha